MVPRSFGDCSLISHIFQPCLLALPRSTKASVTEEDEHGMTVHGGVPSWDGRFGDAPALNTKKAQGWCPREQRLWGGLPHPAPIGKSPSLHQCPHFD